MPKQRITKEMVVDAAFEIARTQGGVGCLTQTLYNEKIDIHSRIIYNTR